MKKAHKVLATIMATLVLLALTLGPIAPGTGSHIVKPQNQSLYDVGTPAGLWAEPMGGSSSGT